jgi:hypothetical protein
MERRDEDERPILIGETKRRRARASSFQANPTGIIKVNE